MIVRDLMSTQVAYLGQDASLTQAAKIMRDEDVGSVPVCEQNKLMGIITDRDIVVRAVAEGKETSTMKVSQFMTNAPVTVSPDVDVHEASKIMSDNQIRRLPVVQSGNLVGMLALGDMAVVHIHENEAGEALSDISQGIRH